MTTPRCRAGGRVLEPGRAAARRSDASSPGRSSSRWSPAGGCSCGRRRSAGPVTFITVTGVSMEPGMHTDDVAVMYERGSYGHGDVVAFRASAAPGQSGQGAYVIHRIVGGTGEDGFVMRGDNNDWDDPWTPTSDEIAGERLFVVPGIGSAMRWVAQPMHLAALVGAMTVALLVADPKTSSSRISGDEEPTEATRHVLGEGSATIEGGGVR
ncbi:MAG: signal peptidase I [Acidimicrobiales bacterium]|nr:signal peptidase I [Acidimicrobiales bacterium]